MNRVYLPEVHKNQSEAVLSQLVQKVSYLRACDVLKVHQSTNITVAGLKFRKNKRLLGGDTF